MSSKKYIPVIAAASTAALVLAGCASTTNSAQSPGSGNSGGSAPSLSVAAQPDDQGKTLFATIAKAQKTVDIVVYSLGNTKETPAANPQLTAALVAAMQKGVKVRLVLDGFNASNHTNNAAGYFAIRNAAIAAGIANPPIQANYSSTNFNITHQKTVIVDGQPNSGGNPNLLISTGNFQDYAGPFWASRDFYVTTPDQNLINQVETVFNSDFSCDGRTVTNNLVNADPLVWSNGSTGVNQASNPGAVPAIPADAQNEYPALGVAGQHPFGYFDYSYQNYPDSTPVHLQVQGNSMAVQRQMIQNAQPGDGLRVYNEEQKSKEIQADLLAAIAKGVDVRLVETFEGPDYAGEPVGAKVQWLQQLAAAGATVNLMAPSPGVAGSVYVHAKMITDTPASGSPTVAYVGSINFSDPSMNDNRELGIKVDSNNTPVITSMNATFDGDYAKAGTLAFMMNKANGGKGYPASWNTASNAVTSDGPVNQPAKPLTPQLAATTPMPPPTPNASVCGAIPLPPTKK